VKRGEEGKCVKRGTCSVRKIDGRIAKSLKIGILILFGIWSATLPPSSVADGGLEFGI